MPKTKFSHSEELMRFIVEYASELREITANIRETYGLAR